MTSFTAVCILKLKHNVPPSVVESTPFADFSWVVSFSFFDFETACFLFFPFTGSSVDFRLHGFLFTVTGSPAGFGLHDFFFTVAGSSNGFGLYEFKLIVSSGTNRFCILSSLLSSRTAHRESTQYLKKNVSKIIQNFHKMFSVYVKIRLLIFKHFFFSMLFYK